MAAMDSFLITVDGSEPEVSTGTVRHLLDTSARFWLDLAGLDKNTADGLLLETFGFHPLAVEDAEHFGQRPKLDRIAADIAYQRPRRAVTVGNEVPPAGLASKVPDGSHPSTLAWPSRCPAALRLSESRARRLPTKRAGGLIAAGLAGSRQGWLRVRLCRAAWRGRGVLAG